MWYSKFLHNIGPIITKLIKLGMFPQPNWVGGYHDLKVQTDRHTDSRADIVLLSKEVTF